MKTWAEILELTDGYLARNGVPDARVAAELLAARLLKTGRGFLASHFERPVTDRYLEAMRRAMSRLVAGEPLQYVLGEWDFRTLTLKCDRRALIPRPETEELVTRVLKFLQRRKIAPRPLVVDVGTGSGCIALSIAAECPEVEVIATDISSEAIALAQENASYCGLTERIHFIVTDGLDDFDEPESLDVIVANPPYIPTAICDTLDSRVKDFEPRNALDGGVSGLDFYERYVADAINLLKPGGGVFFELGDGQGKAVETMLFEAGFDEVLIERDFANQERYASGVMAK